jgi:hypothetical protein
MWLKMLARPYTGSEAHRNRSRHNWNELSSPIWSMRMPWNSATPLAMKQIDAKQRPMDGFRYALRYRALQEQGRLGFSNPLGPAGNWEVVADSNRRSTD